MITNDDHARERVRLILDRSNSPWLTDTEINGFIEMGINEYIRERLNKFGANQKVRDDFGRFVKTVVFSNEPIEIGGTSDEDTWDSYSGVKRRQFVNYDLESSDYLSDVDSQYEYTGGAWGTTQNAGTGCRIHDVIQEGEWTEDFIRFGYLLDVQIKANPASPALTKCKIVSIDDALVAQQDPFNQPSSLRYHAVRVGNIYWIRPGLAASQEVIITYVSNNNNFANIEWLPTHGREEVCLIAARKILGTVADERMPALGNEIKELEGK